jgi:hypothetical protein
LWSGFGELVLVMEWILFMSNVNHGSGGGLVQSFMGSEGMWRGKNYIKLVEVKEGNFGERGEVKFLFFR